VSITVDSPILQSTIKDELIFADPPPMLKVAGVTADTFGWDLDCKERNKKAKTKVFVISVWIIGLIINCSGF